MKSCEDNQTKSSVIGYFNSLLCICVREQSLSPFRTNCSYIFILKIHDLLKATKHGFQIFIYYHFKTGY